MSDFASSHSAEWSNFSNRERREIVVMNISFGTFFVHIVDNLDIARSSESGDRERLGDTPLEKGRTVRTGEYPEGPTNGANLVGFASIESESA